MPVAAGADSWCAIRVEVAAHLTDAVTSFLADEGITTLVTAVLDLQADAPASADTALEAHVPETCAARLAHDLVRWLDGLAAIEPAAAAARVTTTPVPPLDWTAVFRRHHRPVAVGARLVVAPPWDVPDMPEREVLVVEPGMAFGTGQHETTRSCLEEIEQAVAEGAPGSALDVGTGTGILAAALARLGVPFVVAIDTDAAVLPLARSNLARNGVTGVALVAGGVAALRADFDLVVANLLADALVAHADALTARVAAGGRLVVSGVLDTQADTVAAAFPALRLAGVRATGPWRTLRLAR